MDKSGHEYLQEGSGKIQDASLEIQVHNYVVIG